MELIGFSISVIIGILLGLLGSGGSVLALPMLVYTFGLNEKIATAYSLFVVGIGSLFGVVKHIKNVHWNSVFIFGLPSILGVWSMRHYIVPRLSEVFFSLGSFDFTHRMSVFGLFSFLMLGVSYNMLNNKKEDNKVPKNTQYKYLIFVAEGFILGSITGYIGAGGGFLIIPALMWLAKLDIRKALATSLLIITLSSLLGFFLGDAQTIEIDWDFLFKISLLVILGIFIGSFLSRHTNEKSLKKIFAYFIIGMAVTILTIEFII